MSRQIRSWRLVAAAFALVVAAVYLNNTSLWIEPISDQPFLIAHRSLGQGFELEGLTGTTCTAARMLPREHGYLENTIPAIAAAFDFGADAVEIDVQPTADARLVVFHDWTLDCRTEESGRTRDHTLEHLQTLDVGFGYTADGGRSWPFRGRGVGLMPSLDDVLDAFPKRDFVIDVKSNDLIAGELLAEELDKRIPGRGGTVEVFGGARVVAVVRQRLPEIRTMTRPRLKRCGARYVALGWTGYVPIDCRGGLLFVPVNLAPWLWGWPNKLLARMDRVGTRVVLIGDYDGESFSKGFDDPERLEELPRNYSGAIWTDRIDLLGPELRRSDRARVSLHPSLERQAPEDRRARSREADTHPE